jgi:hypothetical protein
MATIRGRGSYIMVNFATVDHRTVLVFLKSSGIKERKKERKKERNKKECKKTRKIDKKEERKYKNNLYVLFCEIHYYRNDSRQ